MTTHIRGKFIFYKNKKFKTINFLTYFLTYLKNNMRWLFYIKVVLNKKSAQASLADFFVFIPGCARSLHRGAEGSEIELFRGGFESNESF
jgi:hypothetical protein